MKYILNLLFLLLPFLNFAQSKTDTTFYYSYEQYNEGGDPGEFPTMKATSSEMKVALSAYAQYPKFAKSKFIERTVDISVTIDENGSISESKVTQPMYLMFDTVALNLVNATGNLWQPAKVKGKATSSIITIPVFFTIRLESNAEYAKFIVGMFMNNLQLSIDSTNTFPVSIHGVDSNILRINHGKFDYFKLKPFGKHINKGLIDDISLHPVFGTVRIGFNLSKDCIISDVQILHSVSKSYDKSSLTYLSNLGNWLEPAHENGQLIDSYTEIDFRYDELGAYQYVHRRRAKNSFLAKEKANEYLLKKEYVKALPYLMKAYNYYLDDIVLLYQISLVNFQLGRNEVGCDYLSKLSSVAIDTSYPASVKEEDINAIFKDLCGIGE